MKTRTCTALFAIAFATILAGCDSSSSPAAPLPPPPPPPPPPPSQSVGGVWFGMAVTPDIPDVVTGFEFDDADGFDIGATPFSSTFTGGVTETRGVPGFYADGINSWHIPGDDPGVVDATITFEIPVLTLVFSTRTVTDLDVASIVARDATGAAIGAPIVPPDAQITEFTIDTTGGLPIASVDITVSSGEIVIDGLTYTFPSTAATDMIGCGISAGGGFGCPITDAASGAVVGAVNGLLSVAVDQVSGMGWFYAAPGETFADGSTIAAMTVSAGVVAEGATLDLTLDGTGVPIAVTTTWSDTTDRGSDLATTEASYMDFDIFGDPSTFDVDAVGAISGQSAAGCMLAGQVSIDDPLVNLYNVAITVTDGGTCGIPAGDYVGGGGTGDAAGTDDLFTFGVFMDGVAVLTGAAVKPAP